MVSFISRSGWDEIERAMTGNFRRVSKRTIRTPLLGKVTYLQLIVDVCRGECNSQWPLRNRTDSRRCGSATRKKEAMCPIDEGSAPGQGGQLEIVDGDGTEKVSHGH